MRGTCRDAAPGFRFAHPATGDPGYACFAPSGLCLLLDIPELTSPIHSSNFARMFHFSIHEL